MSKSSICPAHNVGDIQFPSAITTLQFAKQKYCKFYISSLSGTMICHER